MALQNLPGGFTLGAWYQSLDPAGVLTAINAVPDPHLITQGADIRIPSSLTSIIGKYASANDASLTRAQLQSPSLRSMFLIDVEPIVAAAVSPGTPLGIMHEDSPIPLRETEALNMAILSDPAAGVAHYGLAWLADAARAAVKGQIFSIRCTAAAALTAGAWVNSPLTFGQSLPAGTYAVVGMRARSANLVAARLVFIGYPWRPGVLACVALANVEPLAFRFGRLGVWGMFDNTTPPSIDCLGITDTAQVVILDLIKQS